MLARALARRRGIRVVGVLRRLDHRPQTVRSREGRYRGPTLRLRVRTAHRVRGRRVLLVDDVCTTGSSLRAAAAALRTGGASEVVAAVVALAGTNRRPNEEVVALQ
ncbi:MAG: ComF family protein [Acidimicrobiales bacterium]